MVVSKIHKQRLPNCYVKNLPKMIRSVLFLISVLGVNFAVGQQIRCNNTQKCIPFEDCWEFGPGPLFTWPKAAQKEVDRRTCYKDDNDSPKVIKVCCSNPPRALALLDTKDCGIEQQVIKVAHGENTTLFDYPWMAMLKNRNGIFCCGGSLISERYVLTAAHCNRHIAIVSVRLGEHTISTSKDCNGAGVCAPAPQDIDVEDFIKHPEYSVSRFKNDIALVRLVKPATLNRNVKPICLPIEQKFRKNKPNFVYLAGWGSTENGPSSDILQSARRDIVKIKGCERELKQANNRISLDSSHVCTSGDGMVNHCGGDSGGPLIYYNRRSILHAVIASGSKACGVGTKPGLYTRVSYFINWIFKNLN